jgi:hypothetical protein
MSDREILLRWLTAAAARLSWKRRVRELARLACCLVALLLFAEVLAAFGAPAPVLSALAPLLVLTALAVIALFAWRLVGPTTLAQAAAAADTGAGLKDELKSAHWFAQRGARTALIELLLERAARTAQKLEARRLFPLGVPRSALAAVILTVLTGLMVWFAPRIALPFAQESVVASSPAAIGKNAGAAPHDKKAEKIATESISPEAPAPREQTSGSQPEQTAQQLPAGVEEDVARRAGGARDGRLVAQFLQLLRHRQTAAPEQDPSAQSADMGADAAHGLFEHPQEIQKKDAVALREPTTGGGPEPTARVNQLLREQIREEQRKLNGQPAEGEVTANPRARAVSPATAKPGEEIVHGEGQAAQADARTSIDGDAKAGNDKAKSRAGGTDGKYRESTTAGEADPHPLFSEPTVRLEAQLQKVRAEGTDDPQQATEETLYAATRRQVSKVEYADITAQWKTQRDAALPQSRTPLSYREAVKRYFLTEHGKEE